MRKEMTQTSSSEQTQKKERDDDRRELIKEIIDELGTAAKELKSGKIWDAKFTTESAFHLLHELCLFYDDEESEGPPVGAKCTSCGKTIGR